MKRLHVHVSVKDVAASIRFYRELFVAEPVVVKPDYAKWLLDDPCVNFAISNRARPTGVDHLGIQVEDRKELTDPQGVEWEFFLTTGKSTVYGSDVVTPKAAKPCCTPNRAA